MIIKIPAKNIEEQKTILMERNIKLTPNSTEILLQYGYYNLINGYKDAFIDKVKSNQLGHDFYKDGTTLDQIVSLYRFDADLRRNILNFITIIETQMKSLLSLHFSLRYGTNHWNFLTPSSFTTSPNQIKHVNTLIDKLNKDIRKFSIWKPHPAICHFVRKYNQVPLWALNTVMTFGTMANFYDLLIDDLKKTIARDINPKLTPTTLTSILYYLTDIRNKCAHNNRLYTYKTDQKATRLSTIPQLAIHRDMNLPRLNTNANSTYSYGQDDILAVLICTAVFFGQNHVYRILYDKIDQSISQLSANTTPDVESFVREVTGLKHEYLEALKKVSL